MDAELIKKDFPLLAADKLIYLDNAATTQKPMAVLQAAVDYYSAQNANPHRGAYALSEAATQAYETARKRVADFLHVDADEVIFTKSATEALNIAAFGWAKKHLQPGDEIALAISEHHSNLVPWQQVAKATGAVMNYLYTDSEGRITSDEIARVITAKTRVVAVAHASNVTGVIHPIAEIIQTARKFGATVVVDGTQAVPHMKVDLRALDADFYVFSGHKMLAPMGIGVLYGKKAMLEATDPLLYGGDMIDYVDLFDTQFARAPQKFEGGTQNLSGAVGLAAAIGYLEQFGMDALQKHEEEHTAYLLDSLLSVPGLKIIGPANLQNRLGVVAFNIESAHPHDVATILDADKVCIRSGSHCTQPFHKHMGISATCRASLYLYNTRSDIDVLADSLKKVQKILKI